MSRYGSPKRERKEAVHEQRDSQLGASIAKIDRALNGSRASVVITPFPKSRTFEKKDEQEEDKDDDLFQRAE